MRAAFSKALGQLTDPKFQRVIWTGIGVSALVFGLLFLAVWVVITNTQIFDSWWLGWLETLLDWLGGVAVILFTWLLFPAVASVVIGLLLEVIVSAVEKKHYPELAPAPGASGVATLVSAIKLLFTMVIVNIGLLIFLLIPPVFPFVFYAANGYLLGWEYFELVALRRVNLLEAKRLRQENRRQILLAGVVVALLLTVPVVNLAAPVIGVAVMVHLFTTNKTASPE
jgi:CysZ protein